MAIMDITDISEAPMVALGAGEMATTGDAESHHEKEGIW